MAMYVACLLLLFRSVHFNFISGRWWRRRHRLCLLPNDFLLASRKFRFLFLPSNLAGSSKATHAWTLHCCRMMFITHHEVAVRLRPTSYGLDLGELATLWPFEAVPRLNSGRSSGSRMERFSINLKGRVVDDTFSMMRRFNASKPRRRKLQKTHQRFLLHTAAAVLHKTLHR